MLTYSMEYIDRMAAKASRCNLPVTHGEIEALAGVTRSSDGYSFAGLASRLHRMLFADWVGDRHDLRPGLPGAPARIGFDEAAGRFVVWLREMGYAGEHAEDQIRLFLDWWHADENIAKLPADLVLGRVVRQLGVRRERKRVRDRPYPHNRVMFYTIHDRVSPAARDRADAREQRQAQAA